MRWIAFLLLPAVLLLTVACEAEERSADGVEPTLRPIIEAAVEPTSHPTVEAGLEELFWIAVDVGGIDRTVGFEDAKFLLGETLFTSYNRRLTELEGLGIDPFWEWPFCINASAGAFAIVSLRGSESPVEAAPFASRAVEVILSLEDDLMVARGGERAPLLSPSEMKRKCEQFEDELRELYGW